MSMLIVMSKRRTAKLFLFLLIAVFVYQCAYLPMILYCQTAQMVFRLFSCYYVEPSEAVNFTTDQNVIRYSPSPCQPEQHRYLLFIVIRRENGDLRMAIRSTWLTNFVNDIRFKIFFVVGGPITASLRDEVLRYRDMLLIDHRDSYFNVTHKIHQTLLWTSKYCANVRLVIRADEDVVVFKRPLISYLIEHQPYLNTIVGYCRRFDCVMRVPTSKTCMPIQTYSNSFYPSYCFGFCYLMSANLVRQMLAAWPTDYFHLDDVLIGLLANNLKTGPAALISESKLFDSETMFDTYRCDRLPIAAGSYRNVSELRSRWNETVNRCKIYT